VTDDKYVADRPYTFHYEVADKNVTEAWTRFATTLPTGDATKAAHPRVLTMWGTSDWVVDRGGGEWIAEVVNRTAPGHGRFVVLDSIDHQFFRTASQQESYRILTGSAGAPPRVFNAVFLDTLRAWLQELGDRRIGG